MKTNKYTVGMVIEVFEHSSQSWKNVSISRVSDSFIWFEGSGYERIKMTTIERFPTLYRVKL